MTRYALLIEYDGSRYHGWQIQNGAPTIQGALEAAMERLTQSAVRITGSGRTDTGVHARAQVAHFDSPREDFSEDNYRMGLNSYLDHDIVVKECRRVSDDFHARFQAAQRDYSYAISTVPLAIGRRYAWFLYNKLDTGLLEDLAKSIHGKHDFRSFMHARSDAENTICDIMNSSWIITRDALRYSISGNRFLHNMVRCLVGTMIEVARGRYTPDMFRQFLHEPDKEAPVVRAPAHGLVLERVHYEDDIFQQNQDNSSRG